MSQDIFISKAQEDRARRMEQFTKECEIRQARHKERARLEAEEAARRAAIPQEEKITSLFMETKNMIENYLPDYVYESADWVIKETLKNYCKILEFLMENTKGGNTE